MINTRDILETIHMIEDENLDIRTITMGISLLDCCSQDIDDSCRRVYDKIARKAENLVRVGCEIEKEYGVPIINKRVAVTPIAMLAAASGGGEIRTHARKGGAGCRSQLHRRIFRTRSKGLRTRRRGTHQQHT